PMVGIWQSGSSPLHRPTVLQVVPAAKGTYSHDRSAVRQTVRAQALGGGIGIPLHPPEGVIVGMIRNGWPFPVCAAASVGIGDIPPAGAPVAAFCASDGRQVASSASEIDKAAAEIVLLTIRRLQPDTSAACGGREVSFAI